MNGLLFCLIFATSLSEGDSLVRYRADEIVYSIPEERVILKGNAEVSYGTIRITADSIFYEYKTYDLTAYGSPVLYDGNEKIEGESMTYNIEKKRGEILNAKTEIEKGFFEGVVVRQVGEKILGIKSGKFTTCDLNHPHYFFASSSMKIYQDDIVVCKPLVLFVQDVPVFFLPYWFFPIKKKRHSGFLTPKIGQDDVKGKYVEIPYYLVVNDYSDLTFRLDYSEKRGLKSAIRGRYIVNPFLSGHIDYSFSDDIAFREKIWSLKAVHAQNLGAKFRLNGNADFISSETYYEMSENLADRLRRELHSHLSCSKSWSSASLLGVLDHRRDLEKDETTAKIPGVSFTLYQKEILGSSFSYNNSFNRTVYTIPDTNYTHSKFSNHASLTRPQKFFGWLNITPRVKYTYTVYNREKEEKEFPHTEVYTFSVSANTKIFGLFKKEIGRIKGMAHIITPSVGYSYTSHTNHTKDFSSGLNFALRNDFGMKIRTGGEVKKISLLWINTSGSYNFKEKEKPLSTISNSVGITPLRFLRLYSSFNYDPYAKEVRGFKEDLSISLSKKVLYDSISVDQRLSLRQSYIKGYEGAEDKINLSIDVDFNLTKNWRISYHPTYDLKRKILMTHTLKVYRDLHCWEAEFNFNGSKEHWSYDFKVSIKSIPEIRLKKGLFSFLFP